MSASWFVSELSCQRVDVSASWFVSENSVSLQCRSHSRRRTSECMFVTACIMDEYAEEKRTE